MFIESIVKGDYKLLKEELGLEHMNSMINSEFFSACFYKSQDGNSKIWKKK